MPGSAFSSIRDKVVFPAPDGDDRTSMSPRRAMTVDLDFWLAARAISLFQVLHLLAELFDHALELEPDIGQRDIVRFRADRIGLAIELLRQKIEPATDGAAVCDQPFGLFDMRGKPVELLADVGLARDQDRLLMQPVRIESIRCVEQRRDLFGDPRPD